MAAANAEDYLLRIQTQGAAEAQAATSALAQLEAQIAASGDRASELASKMAVLQSAPVVDIAAYRKLASELDAAQGATAKASQAFVELGGSAKRALDVAKGGAEGLGKEAKAAADKAGAAAKALSGKITAGDAANTKALSDGLGALGASAGGTVGRLAGIGKQLMAMGPAGAVAVLGIALVAAALVLLVSVVTKAISAAGEVRDAFLKLQGALGGSAGAAHEVSAAIDAVSGSSALSRAKVSDYATELYNTGLRGAELQRALEAMAIAGSAGGDKVAAAFLKDAKAAKAAGQSVDELSRKMKAQLGGVAAAQALSLSAQMTKLGETVTWIFSGANIEPFLRGLKAVLGLFDQNSAAGQWLRSVVTAAAEAIIGGMLRAAIFAVKLYLALKPIGVAIAEAFGGTGITGAEALAAAIDVAAFVARTMVYALLAVVAVVAVCVAGFLWLANTVSEAGQFLGLMGANIRAQGEGALAFLAGLPARFMQMGSDLIGGLVAGITGSAGAVISAITGVVGGAISSAKALLGIASDSKVFTAIGGHTAGGMATGLEKGGGEVMAATKGMVGGAVDTAKSTAAGASVSEAKGGGTSFTFTNCAFGEGMTKETLRQWLTEIVEEEGLGAQPAN